ncbi:MAG TPA: aldo/keto reductase [Gammaproteobacteria bacterium]|nr:aldo/keto reductase [Gammaproteobacteria bacterium]
MKQRSLAKTGVAVSEIGLGCWQFGGDFGPMDEATAFEIMQAAVDSGINFFDTADVYGAGRSEALIGEFLRQSKQPIFVATKFGRNAKVYPDKYSEAALRRAVDAALERLSQDAIDLLQLHCVPIGLLREAKVFDWLRRIQDEGLIRYFGASVETEEEGMLCLQQEGLVSLQVIVNIFRQRPLEQLLPAAKARGVGIIVRLPLASGLLSGRYTRDTHFAPTDHRTYNRDGQVFSVGETFAGLTLEKGVALTDELKRYVPADMSMAQMAQRWLLDHDAVTTLITGVSRPEQARENTVASALAPLPADLRSRLAKFYREEVKPHIRGGFG